MLSMTMCNVRVFLPGKVGVMIAHPDHKVNARAGAILLASSSPRRRELIKLLGLPLEIISVDIDEVPLPGERADAMAVRLSREKVQAALRAFRIPTGALRSPHSQTLKGAGAGDATQSEICIILASDTVVSLDGEPLGKPRDADDARSMLRRLRGRTHQVYTAIALLDLRTPPAHRAVSGADTNEDAARDGGWSSITDLASSDVPMRAYADAEIETYLAGGDPFDKAGAYAIQHTGFHPVDRFDHCFANVMGLPLCHVTRSLRELGIVPATDVPSACQRHIGYECPVYEEILTSDE